MGRTKVFVGNLSFRTNDRELAAEFEKAGKVASASIISRGSRSLGYGFVEMESEEDAKKSVELLNKKVIDGREINVEIARPREEKPAAENAAATNGGAAPGGDATRGGGAPRGRRSFRGRGGRFRRGGGPRGPAGEGAPTTTTSTGSPAGEGSAPAGGRGPRPPRAPRAPRNEADKASRTPSGDTLFVANLPFSVDDAGLAAIFQGLNIKAAHVVRKHNARSKGFGFVEFNNADDQQKALTAIDKKNVEGRELIVKIALTENKTGSAPASPAVPAAESK